MNAHLDANSRKPTHYGLNLYCLFVVSWLLHFGTRFPPLGFIRLDLLLIATLTYLAITTARRTNEPATDTDKLLRVLIAYAILAAPFVEWPGSVLRNGIASLIKGMVFYYFTVAFVRTERDVKKFVGFFVVSQLLRVLEPLYLHLTYGYWGSVAYMLRGEEALERLSGAPSDVINPNGLAYVICTVLPFLYFLAGRRWTSYLPWLIFGPACLYALALTGSRSGAIGLVVILIGFAYYSKRRTLWLISIVVVSVVAFPMLSPDMQDRYLSVIGMGDKNSETAEGRLSGVQENFEVALRRPLFGHGLGTSREANVHFGSSDQQAHNLYAEVAQELGFVGLAIWLLLMKSIVSGFIQCNRAYRTLDDSHFLPSVVKAMSVCLAMNLVFSFASYGLSSYEWYLLAGFSVVLRRLLPATSSAPSKK